MRTVFIVTHANESVATGHLMECIVCAEELIKKGYFISFWINKDVGENLKKRIPCVCQEYGELEEEDYQHFVSRILALHPMSVIFNLRKITNIFLEKLKRSIPDNIKMICIDEFGHRDLSADIIINPMIDSYYWDYGNSKAQLFCGAEYLVLSQKMTEFHLKEKFINNEIKNIVISMGGVDPQNYTLSLIDMIPQIFPDSAIHIVIGGGNQCRDEITKKSLKYEMIELHQNVTNLPQMMYEADLLICAGGNTLHEAACVGTPALVMPSMPHEKITAGYFGKEGFGHVIDTDKNLYNEVLNACKKIENLEERKGMSERGKCISDGLGWKRVVKIIESIK